jgi:competence protein ComEA
MLHRLNWQRPPLLFGAAVFAAVAVLLGRGLLPSQDEPALVVGGAGNLHVALGEGFPSPGIRQFHDGLTVSDVINLTMVPGELAATAGGSAGAVALVDGMTLDLVENVNKNGKVNVGWMPARQRLALGIPLHPDRMSHADWVALPGIGEQLATRIESDRQNYGDFGRFEALERVNGIGPAKLRALRPYFVAEPNSR